MSGLFLFKSRELHCKQPSPTKLFYSDLHPGSFRQLAVEQLDHAALYHSFEFLRCGGNRSGRGRRRRFGPCPCPWPGWPTRPLRDCARAGRGSMENHSSCAINCLARPWSSCNVAVLHLVDAFDLAHQQFRIADHLERFVSMLDGILQRRNQALILRKVVGLVTQVLAERRQLSSRFILNYNSITGGSGIAARAAVAMSDQVVLRGLGWAEGNRLRDG